MLVRATKSEMILVYFLAITVGLLDASPVRCGLFSRNMSNQQYVEFINPYLIELAYNVDELYDLEPEVKSLEFKRATGDVERSEVMRKLFLRKRDRLLAKIVREDTYYRSLNIAVLSVFVAGVSYLGYRRGWITPQNYTLVGLLSSSFALAFANQAYGVYMLLSGLTTLQLKGLEGIYIPIQNSEEVFAKNYHKLREQPRLLKNVTEKLKLLRRSSANALTSFEHYIEYGTSIPMISRGTWLNKAKFEERFSMFPPDLREQLLLLANRQVILNRSERKVPNFPVYFQGIPGVGKTYAANALAEATNVSINPVTLDGASIEEVIGTPFSPLGDGKPGRLLSALIAGSRDVNTGVAYRDNILFIDEFDRLLNAEDPQSKAVLSFMLKILDPNNRTFFSPYLGAEIELPRLTILAGNYEIRDEALKNRFEILQFPGYDTETVKRIATQALVPRYCSVYELERECLSKEELGQILASLAGSRDNGLRSAEKMVLNLVTRKAYAGLQHIILNPPKSAVDQVRRNSGN